MKIKWRVCWRCGERTSTRFARYHHGWCRAAPLLEALPPQPAAEIIEAAGIDVWYRVEIHHHQLGLFENNEKQLAVFSRFKPTIRLPESTGAEVSP